MVNPIASLSKKSHISTKIKYEIIKSSRIALLEEMVIKKTEEGWRPQGGIAVENGICYQAMVK